MDEFEDFEVFEVTLDDVVENEGFESSEELLAEYFNEGLIPSMCSQGCMVEPDGTCEHGYESVFLFMGII